MDKKLKNALQAAFEAPTTSQKNNFLQTLNYPKSTYKNFFITQIGYIRKRIWLFLFFIIVLGLASILMFQQSIYYRKEGSIVWMISAIIPFLALMSMAELSRSMFYNMVELEMSCRFSLSQIVMARATILGIGNFVIIALLLVLIIPVTDYGVFRLILYLTVPYLLTCAGSLLVLNRVRGKESIYYCGIISCFVSFVPSIFSTTRQYFYSDSFVPGWLILGIASLLLLSVQMNGLLKRMEVLNWNLLSTE